MVNFTLQFSEQLVRHWIRDKAARSAAARWANTHDVLHAEFSGIDFERVSRKAGASCNMGAKSVTASTLMTELLLGISEA